MSLEGTEHSWIALGGTHNGEPGKIKLEAIIKNLRGYDIESKGEGWGNEVGYDEFKDFLAEPPSSPPNNKQCILVPHEDHPHNEFISLDKTPLETVIAPCKLEKDLHKEKMRVLAMRGKGRRKHIHIVPGDVSKREDCLMSFSKEVRSALRAASAKRVLGTRPVRTNNETEKVCKRIIAAPVKLKAPPSPPPPQPPLPPRSRPIFSTIEAAAVKYGPPHARLQSVPDPYLVVAVNGKRGKPVKNICDVVLSSNGRKSPEYIYSLPLVRRAYGGERGKTSVS
eukprot:TRINITY_DN34170_c0_g1_i1.p1 TRINITY_DN34170_c0_g1~~TRINITY_DN34170_c0_g1_i1.p1  ORF type:complete len:281 (+),score=20.15 TRINITY_DN34170_c0_g1_i1:57-899(+)